MIWRIIADTVMGVHLLLIGFLSVSVVLLLMGFFKTRRNWRFFYWGVSGLALSLGVMSWIGILKSCCLTEIEYMMRRFYDTSESWMRTRSLLGTVIYNVGGIEVPEYSFTIGLGVAITVMICSLIVRRD